MFVRVRTWKTIIPLFLVGIAACMGAADLGGGQVRGSDKVGAPKGEIWRTLNKCSINSLYMFLRLWHQSVAYEDLEARLPVGEHGTSLTEMRDCAAACGLRTKVIKATPETLGRYPLPAIAHCDEEKTTGHYVILVAMNEDTVHVIDGTTAVVGYPSLSEFRKTWSGYLLVNDNRPWWAPLIPVAISLSTISACLALWHWFGWRRAGQGNAVRIR
jgi:hypothetical protein